VGGASEAWPGNAYLPGTHDFPKQVILRGALVNGTFERLYPHITRWVQAHGYIEIGYDDYSRSFLRALDFGGMIWEGLEPYATLDEALLALEYALAEWMRAQGFE
jgi:hypothetical protein